MQNVLVINSSLNGAAGNSAKLAAEFVEKLRNTHPGVTVTQRDLVAMGLPHLASEEMQAWMTPAEERSAEQRALAGLSDQLIAELKAHDVIVVGMPMYNFGVPSVFKAWIDRIARAGVTFRYTETGPVGLLEGKKVVITAARGGQYVGTSMDTQSKYLKDVFGFIGIRDVEFVYAEGLNMGLAETALQQASQSIEAIVGSIAA